MNNTRGLSLIEVLIGAGIAAVAGVLLLVIIVNSTGLFSSHSSAVKEGLNINDALMEVRKSIKESSSVTASYTCGSNTYTTGADQLVLGVASIDPSGNIIEDTYDHFIFYQDQKYFHFKVCPNLASSRQESDRILSTVADGLVFQYFNSAVPPVEVSPVMAKKVRINLTLKEKAGYGFKVNIATSEANIRND